MLLLQVKQVINKSVAWVRVRDALRVVEHDDDEDKRIMNGAACDMKTAHEASESTTNGD